MKIMLVCAAGMSTSLLVKKMEEEAVSQNLETEIFACPEAEMFDKYSGVDIILLAPQVRFLKNKLIERVGDIPVSVIEMRHYGLLDAKSILDSVNEILK